MIISHSKKFIYIKAPRSASSSVQRYFENAPSFFASGDIVGHPWRLSVKSHPQHWWVHEKYTGKHRCLTGPLKEAADMGKRNK
jgi:hypothetical protein